MAENNKKIISDAASEAIKVVAEAAQKAVITLASAASSAQALVNLDIGYIKTDIGKITKLLESNYVTKEAFNPVKIIAYGIAGMSLVGVVGAVVSMVIVRKGP